MVPFYKRTFVRLALPFCAMGLVFLIIQKPLRGKKLQKWGVFGLEWGGVDKGMIEVYLIFPVSSTEKEEGAPACIRRCLLQR
jgi:hypothetical protein